MTGRSFGALLCGLGPGGAPDACLRGGTRPSARGFRSSPTSKDPRETALAEAEKVAKLAADRGVEPGPGQLADGWRPAGEPLVARDVYGSRRLVMAPFSCDGGAPDHWYAWDIDAAPDRRRRRRWRVRLGPGRAA